jgi:hypothetical protein
MRGREAVNAIVAGVCFGGERGVLSIISAGIELSGDNWWEGKCGSVRCVGGVWGFEMERRYATCWEGVHELCTQSLEGKKVLNGIGDVEASWRKRRSESGDVGFMLAVVELESVANELTRLN